MSKNNALAKYKVENHPKTQRKYERVSNVRDFCRVMAKHGDKVAFTYFDKSRQLHDVTYAEFYRMVKRTAAGLTELGLEGKRVAVMGETSTKWVATYLAVLSIGGIVIPVDKELEVKEIVGLLESVDTDAVVYSDMFNGKLRESISENSTIKNFIPMFPDENEAGEGVFSFDAMLKVGKAKVNEGYKLPDTVDRERLAELLFTSGTTGTSKSVMLSQKNIFSAVTSACETVPFTPEDTIVSVLPIHHTYELACMLAALDYGLHVCINDSLTRVLRNFQTFKPTGLVLVPLFVYTMYKKIWAEAKKTGRDKKLKIGLAASKAMRKVGIDKRSELFEAVTSAFGGRLEKIICGGAALNPKMIEFFGEIGINIYEGFGITECAPLTFVTPYYAQKVGSVGPAVPCCQGRIDGENIGAHGYVEGEIQIKGDNVMLGYYNNPEATADVFTDDGWFRTGDMGYMDKDGYFYITGRLKSVIVLENGKNIFPEEIEEYLAQIDLIAESVVVGRQDGTTVNLVALVYPDFTKFAPNQSEGEILETIEKAIQQMNRRLPTHKQIKMVEIRDTEFEKTTSKKIKRHLVS